MARYTETKADLQERIAELEDENQALQDQLDAIADIATGENEGEDDDQGEPDGED